MRIADIAYEVDGKPMVGHFAIDNLQPGLRPAVLVCHEGSGLGENAKGRAVRLAGLGYAAFALDYFGDGKAPPRDEAMARLGVLMGDPQLTREMALAGLHVLLEQEQVDTNRVAVIGYCFGGAMAVELARTGADLAAVVGFHPGIGPPNPTYSRNIRASILMCCGADDPVVPPERRVEFEADMKEAGVADWRIEVYGGVGHSFTNPLASEMGMPGFAYDATADRRSWRSMLDLFAEKLRN